jgi:segregation and condensation protein A
MTLFQTDRQQADYQIKIPAFSGPLDLLLHLIERQELDITAISLVEVTGQYLAQVEAMRGSRIENLIDFLVVGARLTVIKSRALLPPTPVTRFGEEEEEEDPAEALLRQLRAYKQYKDAAHWLQQRDEAGLHTHLRVAPPPRVEKKLDLSGVTPHTLQAALRQALAQAQEMEDSVSLIQPRRITIGDQVEKLRRRLRWSSSFLFDEALSPRPDRIEVAVTLLAVLELIKQKEMIAFQPEMFGPIKIGRPETAVSPPPATD